MDQSSWLFLKQSIYWFNVSEVEVQNRLDKFQEPLHNSKYMTSKFQYYEGL